ncbi:MAG: PilN domain-containing protein [Candidatus Microsaccharimonas sp.]
MINLMPDDAKREIRAARANVVLVRYITILLISAAFLALVVWGSYLLLGQIHTSAQQQITANDTQAAVYSQTKQQVDSLSAGLTEAKTILDQEILYSNVLVNIAQQMPANTVIDKLTLDSNSFIGTPLTLKVYAKSSNDAVALRDRFQSSPFFSNVSFESVSDTSGGITGYPVSATITLTLNRAISQ